MFSYDGIRSLAPIIGLAIIIKAAIAICAVVVIVALLICLFVDRPEKKSTARP
ncbi:MAG: hypothetical protein PHV78_01405 [Patescibacteria group bacterium]|nr:hypothetical protein [Patescibacteria group bacterium]MDD5121188.1 hypothetical protein [Patescibacteria group bacterium]MDD5222000.1 hypothetical protein [Patescibacteria group bacterium]MDD5395893.1 hypothetical protein [Patescibacteria group bacterium]